MAEIGNLVLPPHTIENALSECDPAHTPNFWNLIMSYLARRPLFDIGVRN
jgi:hypothetical protein